MGVSLFFLLLKLYCLCPSDFCAFFLFIIFSLIEKKIENAHVLTIAMYWYARKRKDNEKLEFMPILQAHLLLPGTFFKLL